MNTKFDRSITLARRMIGLAEKKRSKGECIPFFQDIGYMLARAAGSEAEEWKLLGLTFLSFIRECTNPEKYATEITCLMVCTSLLDGWTAVPGTTGIISINSNEISDMKQCLKMAENIGQILRRTTDSGGGLQLVASMHDVLLRAIDTKKPRNKEVHQALENIQALVSMWLTKRHHILEEQDAYLAFRASRHANKLVLGLYKWTGDPPDIKQLLLISGIRLENPQYSAYRKIAINLANGGQIIEWTHVLGGVRLTHRGRSWAEKFTAELSNN